MILLQIPYYEGVVPKAFEVIPDPSRFCSPQSGLTFLMRLHKTRIVRAVEASHAACKDEFWRHPRSHRRRFFSLLIIHETYYV